MGSATLRAIGGDVDYQYAYAGEVSPEQAWEELSADKEARLIDVRTPPEWIYAGEPNLSGIGKHLIKVSWKVTPTYAINTQFAQSLSARIPNLQAPLFFICRTGGRSLDAACAMTAHGYSRCYNVTDGFEGPLSAQHQRGTVAGWKAAGLPWRQE